MEKYTIYCTKEQTRKAFELGAPIKMFLDGMNNPTAEQMIGWLEEQGFIFYITYYYGNWGFDVISLNSDFGDSNENYNSRKETTIAAIDSALAYLSKKGE